MHVLLFGSLQNVVREAFDDGEIGDLLRIKSTAKSRERERERGSKDGHRLYGIIVVTDLKEWITSFRRGGIK